LRAAGLDDHLRNFTVSRPRCGAVLELLPPVLLLKPMADGGWLEAILQRMVVRA
jgi:hypothetical protein